MSDQLKAFKTYRAARQHAGSKPIVRVGNLYLVGANSLTSVELMNGDGRIVGQVIMRHLNRLGNANHASGRPGSDDQPQIDWTKQFDPEPV